MVRNNLPALAAQDDPSLAVPRTETFILATKAKYIEQLNNIRNLETLFKGELPDLREIRRLQVILNAYQQYLLEDPQEGSRVLSRERSLPPTPTQEADSFYDYVPPYDPRSVSEFEPPKKTQKISAALEPSQKPKKWLPPLQNLWKYAKRRRPRPGQAASSPLTLQGRLDPPSRDSLPLMTFAEPSSFEHPPQLQNRPVHRRRLDPLEVTPEQYQRLVRLLQQGPQQVGREHTDLVSRLLDREGETWLLDRRGQAEEDILEEPYMEELEELQDQIRAMEEATQRAREAEDRLRTLVNLKPRVAATLVEHHRRQAIYFREEDLREDPPVDQGEEEAEDSQDHLQGQRGEEQDL
ncbi:hypothetical protein OBBRIDRAFT_839915 [Obba rivulosa]|uniref:Uncharacterized protein n=1 Tax=Obba rivulosa TaxID=1052685 RepID=A0A8E2AS15_9APHY|nr:hypothetical protein OBBRIDRAFT_839915 [Obba rivulosa]